MFYEAMKKVMGKISCHAKRKGLVIFKSKDGKMSVFTPEGKDFPYAPTNEELMADDWTICKGLPSIDKLLIGNLTALEAFQRLIKYIENQKVSDKGIYFIDGPKKIFIMETPNGNDKSYVFLADNGTDLTTFRSIKVLEWVLCKDKFSIKYMEKVPEKYFLPAYNGIKFVGPARGKFYDKGEVK